MEIVTPLRRADLAPLLRDVGQRLVKNVRDNVAACEGKREAMHPMSHEPTESMFKQLSAMADGLERLRPPGDIWTHLEARLAADAA